MSPKRKHRNAQDTEALEPNSKRARKARPQQNASIDPNSGQKYVFASHHSSTTIPLGEESDFEDDADAMAYLLSVRSQASGIPHVLVAPKVHFGPQLPKDLARPQESEDGEVEDDDDDRVDRSMYNTGIGDARGFYDDGAYIGRADGWDEQNINKCNGDNGGDDGEPDEQQEATEDAISRAYSDAVLRQYHQLRARLAETPPPDPATTHDAAAHFSPGPRASKIWAPALRNTDPNPAQVSRMSKDGVVRVLRFLLGGKFLRRGHPLPERTSRWLWALLARLPDRGELNHSEVGLVRDLGRRAVLLGTSLAEMAALREEIDAGGLGAHDAVEDSGGSSDDDDVVAVEESDGEADVCAETEMATSVLGPGEDVAEAADEALDMDKEKFKKEEEAEEDTAMDTGSEPESSDEGEIHEIEPGGPESQSSADSLETAKLQLLAQLESQPSPPTSPTPDDRDAARQRSRINMRATLNMIITVVGEFYGQRDLLEFRQPFVGM